MQLRDCTVNIGKVDGILQTRIRIDAAGAKQAEQLPIDLQGPWDVAFGAFEIGKGPERGSIAKFE